LGGINTKIKNSWKAYINGQQSTISNQQYGEVVASYFDGEIKGGEHKNIFLEKATLKTWERNQLPKIEFGPQRLFYVGLGVSLATFLACVGYLGYSFARKKIVAKNE